MTLHLPALPQQRAATAPHHPAIEDERVSLTNRGFADAVVSAAALMSSRGISHGDVVAIMLPNRVDFLVALFAAWRLGAAATPIDPASKPHQIERHVAHCGVVLVVTTPRLILQTPLDVARITDLGQAPPVARLADRPIVVRPTDRAVIICSIGSGQPVRADIQHGDLAVATSMTIAEFGLDTTTHSLLILPLAHLDGIVVGALAALGAGGWVTIAARFDPTAFFDRIGSTQATFVSARPSAYSAINDLPEEFAPDTSGLKLALCTAPPASAELMTHFERRFGVRASEYHGLCAAMLLSDNK